MNLGEQIAGMESCRPMLISGARGIVPFGHWHISSSFRMVLKARSKLLRPRLLRPGPALTVLGNFSRSSRNAGFSLRRVSRSLFEDIFRFKMGGCRGSHSMRASIPQLNPLSCSITALIFLLFEQLARESSSLPSRPQYCC